MPFVDLLRFKNNSTDYIWRKKGKIFRKNQQKKIPKSLKFGEKNPRIPRKITGIF
jgi:hypothetical protein